MSLVLDGVARRETRQQEAGYYNAYVSGLLSQQYERGKFPKYEKYSPSKRKKSTGIKRDWRELKMILETWNATAGGFDNRVK